MDGFLELLRLKTGVSAMTPEQLAQKKADDMNASYGLMTGINCPVCKNKGYVAIVSGTEVYTPECKCMGKRRSMQRLMKSGLGGLLDIYTFEKFEAPEKWQQTAKLKAEAFMEQDSGWMIMCGKPGTGKTHLCTAASMGLMEKYSDMRYVIWRETAPRLKACINDREEYEALITPLKRVPVLYIDDFFKGNVTEGDINLAFELLNGRYVNPALRTLISTEKSLEQLLEIDEAIGSRIYERSKGFVIKTGATNWRLR